MRRRGLVEILVAHHRAVIQRVFLRRPQPDEELPDVAHAAPREPDDHYDRDDKRQPDAGYAPEVDPPVLRPVPTVRHDAREVPDRDHRDEDEPRDAVDE